MHRGPRLGNTPRSEGPMGPEGRAGVRRAKGVAIVVAVSIALGGCALIRAKRDQKQLAAFGRLQGTQIETNIVTGGEAIMDRH